MKNYKISEDIYISSSLYTMLGKEVNGTSELVSGEKYVAVGHGKRQVNPQLTLTTLTI